MTFRDVEVRHLLALQAVAEEGSFGRAASRLGFTQSAISQQVAALERVIGEPVFDRPGGRRPVALTPAGRVLLKHANSIVAKLSAAEEDLARLRAGESGRLVIGTFQSVSVRILPEVISRLREERPSIDVKLIEEDENHELVRLLCDGELDLTFLAADDGVEEVDVVHLCDDPHVVLSPPELATPGPTIPARDLIGSDLIGQPTSTCQAFIDRTLRSLGVEPLYVFRSSDNSAVQAMVRAGMGRAVMPWLGIDPTDPGVVVQDVDPPLEARSIYLARLTGRTLPAIAERFTEIALEVARSVARPDMADAGSARR